jgi:hypothetical protein
MQQRNVGANLEQQKKWELFPKGARKRPCRKTATLQ